MLIFSCSVEKDRVSPRPMGNLVSLLPVISKEGTGQGLLGAILTLIFPLSPFSRTFSSAENKAHFLCQDFGLRYTLSKIGESCPKGLAELRRTSF